MSSTATMKNQKTSNKPAGLKKKIALEKGTTPQLLFTSKNSAELDATAYETKKAEFAMTGGKAYINATEVVKLDLKGSLVSFMNDPVIDIVKVEKSTITHFNGKK